MAVRRTALVGGMIVLAVTGTLIAACGTAPGTSTAGPGTSTSITASGGPLTATASSGSGRPSPGSSPHPSPTSLPGSSPSASSGPSSPAGRAPTHAPAPAPTTSAASRTHEALSGVGAADRDAWGVWRGQPVQINETWNDAKDSSGAVTWEKMDGLYSTRANFSDGRWKGALSIGQPMFADNETIQQCASVSEITTWAKDLKAAWPSGIAYIRLGWEFNGDWYHWKVGVGDAAAYKACWIRWYGQVKRVSSKFELVWNPNNQSSDPHLDVRDFWPGKAYVDAAGPDNYALSWGGKLMDPDMTGPNGEPLGIGAWAAWVAHKGVPLAVPEWAIRQQTWGSTDPKFIDEMRAAFVKAAKSSTGLAYESYFDGGTGYQCQFSIHDPACGDVHQAASDEYRKLWSRPYLG